MQRDSITSSRKRGYITRASVFGTLIVIVIIGIGSASWLFLFNKHPDADPFTTSTLASLDFPIYYPRTLPSGYRINPKSVTEPLSGVVVFTIIGPNNQKLYMSQETRPATFNFGGYYKAFANVHETTTPEGTIAVGYINKGVTAIGSLATDKIVVNTTTQLPLSDLTSLLNSLAVSH
jgi:hypothetical protein